MCKMVKPITRTTEIRHVSPLEKSKLAEILNNVNSWKILMEIIPKKLKDPENLETNDNEFKYNRDDIKTIANAARPDRLAGEILFDEWGTSGRQRPTVSHLLQLLVKAELFRAADYVAVNLLNETPPARPVNGPAAKIEIPFSNDEDAEQLNVLLSGMDYPPSSNLNDIPIESEFHQNKDRSHLKPTHENVQKIGAAIIPPASNIDTQQNLIEFSSSSSSSGTNKMLMPISSLLMIPNDSSTNEEQLIAHTDDQLPNISALVQSSISECVTSQSEIELLESNDMSGISFSANIPHLPALNDNFTSQMSSFNLPALSELDITSNANISEENLPNLSILQ